MHSFISLLILVVLATSVRAQQASTSLLVENYDEVDFLQSSLTLTESQANLFWPLYEQFGRTLSAVKANTGAAMIHLSNANAKELSQRMIDVLRSQKEEVLIRKELFDKVQSLTNGTVAFQVIQSEAIFNLLERSKVYDEVWMQRFIGDGTVLRDEAARIALMEELLEVPDAVIPAFRDLAEQYEFEYSRIVGHDMAFFELYIEDPKELTPGQSKKLGSCFVSMQMNEVSLKERFFGKLSEAFGDEFAVRFVLLEEYFGVMNKLRAWSEYLEYHDTLK